MKILRNCLLVWLLLYASQPVGASSNNWIATWASSPQARGPNPREPLLNIDNQTVRERVRVSIGGSEIRLRFSNEFGSSPLVIGSSTVAALTDASSVKEESVQSVTFEGHSSVTIPAGAPVLSDPVKFPVTSGAEISISIYFPKRVTTPTLHAFAFKHTVISPSGDFTHAEKIQAAAVSTAWISVTAVLVPTQSPEHTVVALGDSITDGDGSTVDADNNWPSNLVRRATKATGASTLAIVNEGIVGNRLLRDGDIFGLSALARFDRDVLTLPGVTHVVLLEGINDICFPGAKWMGNILPIRPRCEVLRTSPTRIGNWFRAHMLGESKSLAPLLRLVKA
jgi:hypothetical protein